MSDRTPRYERAAAACDGPAIIARRDPRQLTFLPEVDPAPTRPNPGTLADVLVRMLADGARLTHPDFEELTGSWRLAAVAFELGLLGWPLTVERIPAPTPERPDRSIARYSFDASARSAALEMLR
jgi:hypothetical protein